MRALPWPLEQPITNDEVPAWAHAGSNLCLDFHGDPIRARVRIFSDGNHHMALHETLQAFARLQAIDALFYLTLPPPALLPILQAGRIDVGNLRLSLRPDIFISPPAVLERVRASGQLQTHTPFMRSRGHALLFRKLAPLPALTALDNADLRLFLPHPQWESAAYEAYTLGLSALAQAQGWHWDFAAPTPHMPRLVYGERIHHREAPTYIANGHADVALVYYHLALRYTRIFPDTFAFIPLLDGAASVTTAYHVALMPGANREAQALHAFLLSERTTEIYRGHGLTRADDGASLSADDPR